MRKILTSFALVAASLAFAQVGVNNDNPQATLDVKAKETTGTTTGTDGVLIPRVDRARAQSMSTVEESTLIYVNSVSTGTQSGKAQNIDVEGFYYYEGDNTSGKWVKLGSGAHEFSATKTVVDGPGDNNLTEVLKDKSVLVVHLVGSGPIVLPPASLYPGRVVSIVNNIGGNATYTSGTIASPQTNIRTQSSHLLWSAGSEGWWVISGRTQ